MRCELDIEKKSYVYEASKLFDIITYQFHFEYYYRLHLLTHLLIISTTFSLWISLYQTKRPLPDSILFFSNNLVLKEDFFRSSLPFTLKIEKFELFLQRNIAIGIIIAVN